MAADDPHDESHYLKLADDAAAAAAIVTDPALKHELTAIAQRFKRLAEHAARKKG